MERGRKRDGHDTLKVLLWMQRVRVLIFVGRREFWCEDCVGWTRKALCQKCCGCCFLEEGRLLCPCAVYPRIISTTFFVFYQALISELGFSKSACPPICSEHVQLSNFSMSGVNSDDFPRLFCYAPFCYLAIMSKMILSTRALG